MTQSDLFDHALEHFGAADIGKVRSENQDAVILCPAEGFFAVSDGMGGLTDGGRTSGIIAGELPPKLAEIAQKVRDTRDAAQAEALLRDTVAQVSDNIYQNANKGKHIGFGATISGVWLVGDKAVFVNIGDSRGYILPGGGGLKQVTIDHNVAQLMVERGELHKAQARFHPTSSQLMCFAGMPAPAVVDTFVETVQPGDRILLCSDGLHGMVDDAEIEAVLHRERSAEKAGRRLIKLANQNGGRDNISVVVLVVAS